jgi:hypothetical protein
VCVSYYRSGEKMIVGYPKECEGVWEEMSLSSLNFREVRVLESF